MDERHEEITSALPPDLDALPRCTGFRLRGFETTRLETFIHAAFAFAITMLVIGGQQIPADIETLLGAFKIVPPPRGTGLSWDFLARSLALEPTLRTGIRRVDLHQLGHAGDHPDLHLSTQDGL